MKHSGFDNEKEHSTVGIETTAMGVRKTVNDKK